MFHDDAHLWKAFQQGNIEAFAVIYETHAALLLSYGKRLCSDHDLVKDLVQDIFIDIWTRRQTLKDLHTIKYYLFRILRNRLAKLHQQPETLVSDTYLTSRDDLITPSVEFLITQQETSQYQVAQLQQAIVQLPTRQREAILLAYYDAFSNEEIAGIMGINQQSVTNHLNRALAFLRDWIVRMSLLFLCLEQLL